MNEHLTGLLLLAFVCTLLTVLLMMSHLPVLRRINRDMWRFVLESMGKKKRFELAVRELDAWTAWLGFSWGLSLLPVSIGLVADVIGGGGGGFLDTGYAPLLSMVSLLLLIVSSFICTLCSGIRWLCLRGRDEPPSSSLPPLP